MATGAVIVEPKICENCSTTFYRRVRSGDKYCARCHHLVKLEPPTVTEYISTAMPSRLVQ